MLESVANVLLDLVREHGPLLLFAAALLENAAFLSWLVPGEKLVAVGGYFVQQGDLRFEQAWLYVFLGVLIGDHVGFFVGRFAGKRLLPRLPFRRALERVEPLIQRHGGWVVLFGRFSGILRPAVLFTVGMMGLPYRQFCLFELIGAATWSLVWLGIGVLGGSLIEYLGAFGPWVPWVSIGSSALGWLLVWHFRHQLRRLILGEGETGERAPQLAS
jgi:membrane-associated protein